MKAVLFIFVYVCLVYMLNSQITYSIASWLLSLKVSPLSRSILFFSSPRLVRLGGKWRVPTSIELILLLPSCLKDMFPCYYKFLSDRDPFCKVFEFSSVNNIINYSSYSIDSSKIKGNSYNTFETLQYCIKKQQHHLNFRLLTKLF